MKKKFNQNPKSGSSLNAHKTWNNNGELDTLLEAMFVMHEKEPGMKALKIWWSAIASHGQ